MEKTPTMLELAQMVIKDQYYQQCKRWDLNSPTFQAIEINGLIFGCFNCYINSYKNAMGRYGLYLISGTTILYEDSNVVDSNMMPNVYKAIERAQNYFAHYNKKLSEIPKPFKPEDQSAVEDSIVFE